MLINLMLAAVVRNYEIQTRAAEATARHRRDCAIQAAFTLLDLNSNGFVDLVELSALLQRVSEPVFSLFDGEMSRALDTARTMHSLQRMLEGDAALPVRGLGPTAFAECVLALQKDHSLTAHVGELLDDEDDDTDAEASGWHGASSEASNATSLATSPRPSLESPSPPDVPPLAPLDVPAAARELLETEGRTWEANPSSTVVTTDVTTDRLRGLGPSTGGTGADGDAGGGDDASAGGGADGDGDGSGDGSGGGSGSNGGRSSGGSGGGGGSSSSAFDGAAGSVGVPAFRPAERGPRPLPDPRCASLESLPEFLRVGSSASQLSLGGSGPDGDRSEGGLRHRASSTREVRWSDEGAPYIDERRWSDERRQVVVIESEDGMRATIGAPLPSPRSTGSPAVRMVRRAVRSARFDLAIDAVLVLNMALVLSEIELLLSGEWDALRAIEASTAPLFSLVFVGEAALKLWVLGYHRFFRRRDQTYALIVAGLTAIADVINFVMDGQLGTDDGLSDDVEVRIALGCRLLRLPRLVFSLQRGNPFFSRLLKELNAFGGLFGLIVVLFTFYGQLGVALFGGKIRVDTFPNATDGGDGGLFIPLIGASIPPDYAYCNFNDFPSALLTLFYQLMINNWFLTMELAVLVTRTDWARVYFVSWYWLAAICMTNLVVAQILQVSQVAAGGAHEGAREHAANGHEGARHTAQGARARVAVGSAPAALSAHVTAALRRLAQETPESTPHPRQPTPLRRQATAGPVLQSSVSQLLVATAEGGTAAPAAARTDADCTTQPALDSAAASVGSHGL